MPRKTEPKEPRPRAFWLTRTLEARTPGEERVAARRGDIWGGVEGEGGRRGGVGRGAVAVGAIEVVDGAGRDMFWEGDCIYCFTYLCLRESEYSNGLRTGCVVVVPATGGSRT